MREKKSFTQLFTTAATACALALGLGIAAPRAQAQLVPSYSIQALGLPATLPAATTTNYVTPPFIDCSKQQTMAFMLGNSWSTGGEGTGSTNVLYTLAPTVDGTHWDTNKTVVLASYNRSATAGQTTYSYTNLSANGIKGWYVIKAVNNSAGGVCTNASDAFVYGLKLGAP
jgi:hypothetical protein